MMKIIVRYTSPLIRLTKKRNETIDVPDQSTVKDAIHSLAKLHGDEILRLFFNDSPGFESMFMVVRNGNEKVALDKRLVDKDEIALIAQLAGG
ncbi:MAG TPA: MoaD/ThiS family protein [Anaerolineales bacterium]|jgi:molybdopterin converting factor small subunit|nr:hypothetical protein [Anaerolineaceae bacterium]HJO34213.1 MoaD/ThiS family protein [Anaerolineales bacterium]|tara:strand:+ start:1887 stop:2165 length:279 start_codon:yes stop_codon:yes gene_type:complete